MQFENLPRGVPGRTVADNRRPSAGWLDPAYLKSDFWAYRPGKLILGVSPGGDVVSISDNRHLFTVAGSRAGKGLSVIVPNLLTYPGSVMVLDPKGENATLTAERRGQGRDIKAGGMGHSVFVLDPFGSANVDDAYRAGWNPLDALDPQNENFVDDCDSIADALVIASDSQSNPYFDRMAAFVIQGFVAWVAATCEGAERNLKKVDDLLSIPKKGDANDKWLKLLIEMSESPDVAFGLPAQVANTLLSLDGREGDAILSTVRSHISFLASPPMARLLSGGGRSPDLKKWKMGGQSVYLCLPATRLHRHSRFFRLFVNRLLNAVEAEPAVPDQAAVMILDEMHVLGRMAMLETAAGLVAGYGVRLWSIWQDFAQLESIYQKRWESFLGNASVFQAFGLNDSKSLEYVEKRLGKAAIISVTENEISTQDAVSGFSGQSKSVQESSLLAQDEISQAFSRQSNNQLVIYSGASPMFLRRLPYTDDIFSDVRPG